MLLCFRGAEQRTVTQQRAGSASSDVLHLRDLAAQCSSQTAQQEDGEGNTHLGVATSEEGGELLAEAGYR